MYVLCRGETFRKLLLRIGEVRSLLPETVNVMALTATATVKLRKDAAKVIGMRNELVVSKSPCKDNIMHVVVAYSTVEEVFSPVAHRLLEQGAKCPRMLIIILPFLWRLCRPLFVFQELSWQQLHSSSRCPGLAVI